MTSTELSLAPSEVNRSANGVSRRLRNSTKLTFLSVYVAHLCARDGTRNRLTMQHGFHVKAHQERSCNISENTLDE